MSKRFEIRSGGSPRAVHVGLLRNAVDLALRDVTLDVASLGPDGLSPMANSLTSLTLVDCDVSGMPAGFLTCLRNLRELTLSRVAGPQYLDPNGLDALRVLHVDTTNYDITDSAGVQQSGVEQLRLRKLTLDQPGTVLFSPEPLDFATTIEELHVYLYGQLKAPETRALVPLPAVRKITIEVVMEPGNHHVELPASVLRDMQGCTDIALTKEPGVAYWVGQAEWLQEFLQWLPWDTRRLAIDTTYCNEPLQFMEKIRALPRLESLSWTGHDVDDECPKGLPATLTSLTLDVRTRGYWDSEFTGSGLAHLPQLETLVVKNAELRDDSVPVMPSLTSMTLDGRWMDNIACTGAILAKLPALRELELDMGAHTRFSAGHYTGAKALTVVRISHIDLLNDNLDALLAPAAAPSLHRLLLPSYNMGVPGAATTQDQVMRALNQRRGETWARTDGSKERWIDGSQWSHAVMFVRLRQMP